MQAIKVYGVWLKSIFNKVFANLGKEIVVAICGSVLLGLFFYMFTDFLNKQLASIPQETQVLASSTFCYITCLIGALLSIKTISADTPSAQNSISGWLYRSGELPMSILWYRTLRASTIAVFLFLGIYFVLNRYVENIPANFEYYATAAGFLSFILGLVLKPRHKKINDVESKFTSKLGWRLNILFFRHKQARKLFAFSFLLILLTGSKTVTSSPLLLWAICFTSGLFSSFGLYLNFADELKASWIEKNAGMAHAEYMRLANLVSAIISAILAVIAYTMIALGSAYFNLEYDALTLIQFTLITIAPVLVVPNVILQIDGRRASINMMAGFLVSLFLCTAIFAHIAATLVILALFYYGTTTQIDRYYRA